MRTRLAFYFILLKEFAGALALFSAIALVSGALITQFHEAAQGHSFAEGVWSAIMLMFLQSPLPFPKSSLVAALYFLLPVVGIALVAEQVVRFCVLVFNKENRLEDWYLAMISTYHDHYIVCGLGNVGYRVVLYLQKLGLDVVAVELKADSPFAKEIQDRGVPVLIGDARHGGMLQRLGLERAQALLALTNDDLANLEIVLDARHIVPDIRVVLRMFDDALAGKLQKAFNIQVAFSSSALAGPAFAAASTSPAVKQSFHVGDDIYHVAEFKAGAGLAGKSVGEAERTFPCSILAVVRDDAKTIFPPSERMLARGDRIIAAAALETIVKMERSV